MKYFNKKMHNYASHPSCYKHYAAKLFLDENIVTFPNKTILHLWLGKKQKNYNKTTA
jgi:hypothetical protein